MNNKEHKISKTHRCGSQMKTIWLNNHDTITESEKKNQLGIIVRVLFISKTKKHKISKTHRCGSQMKTIWLNNHDTITASEREEQLGIIVHVLFTMRGISVTYCTGNF